jgi:hypothetical protein
MATVALLIVGWIALGVVVAVGFGVIIHRMRHDRER